MFSFLILRFKVPPFLTSFSRKWPLRVFGGRSRTGVSHCLVFLPPSIPYYSPEAIIFLEFSLSNRVERRDDRVKCMMTSPRKSRNFPLIWKFFMMKVGRSRKRAQKIQRMEQYQYCFDFYTRVRRQGNMFDIYTVWPEKSATWNTCPCSWWSRTCYEDNFMLDITNDNWNIVFCPVISFFMASMASMALTAFIICMPLRLLAFWVSHEESLINQEPILILKLFLHFSKWEECFNQKILLNLPKNLKLKIKNILKVALISGHTV